METWKIIAVLSLMLFSWWIGLHENDQKIKTLDNHITICAQNIKLQQYQLDIIAETFLNKQNHN